MQKSILYLAVVGIILSMASTQAQANEPFNGTYFGAGLGISQLVSKQSISSNSEDNGTQQFPADRSAYFTDSSPNINFFVGRGKTWQRFYLGGEAFVNLNTHTINSSSINPWAIRDGRYFTLTTNNSIKTSPIQFGIAFRPGYLLTPTTLLYGKAGIAIQPSEKISTIGSMNHDQISTSTNVTLNSGNSANKIRAAWSVGLGLEQYITQKLSLRLEYLYTDYGNTSIDSAATGEDALSNPLTVNNYTKSHLTDNTVMLAMSYYLDGTSSSDSFSNSNSPSVFDGAYVGAGLSGSELMSKESVQAPSTIVMSDIPIDYPINATGRYINSNIQGNLFAGIGEAWGRYYLGGEAFADLSNQNIYSTNSSVQYSPGFNTFYDATATNKVTLGPLQVGIGLRSGLLVTPSTLLYGRLGPVLARVKYSSNATNNGALVGPSETWSVPLSLSSSTTRVGWQIGLGLEKHISNNTSIRLEYSYTDYGHFYLNGTASGTSTTGSPVSISNHTSIHLLDQVITLGMAYKLPG